MPKTSQGPAAWRGTAAVTALAAGFAALFIAVAMANVGVPPPEAGVRGYTSHFSPPRSAFEVVLLHSDGQAYASLAMDPALTDPTAFAEGPNQAAYFSQRPVLIYGVWGLSLGSPDRLLVGFVVMTVLGAAVMVGGGSTLLRLRSTDADHRLAIVLLCLPGSLISVFWLSHDALATGLAVCGVAAWFAAPRRFGLAALLFGLAVLTRESMLVVPVVLGVELLLRRRVNLRSVAALAAPAVAFGAWLLVIHSRFGVFPSGVARRTLGPPLAGIIGTVAQWGVGEYFAAVLGLALVGAAAFRSPKDPLSWVGLAFLGFGLLLNTPVWARAEDFSRVLLAMYVFPAIALLGRPTKDHRRVREVQASVKTESS